MQKYFDKDFDKDGQIARQGSINKTALSALKSASYFQESIPKTTGPEVFNLNWVDDQLTKAGIQNLSSVDLIATLTRLTAETIAEAIKKISNNTADPSLYVSGGGFHNPILMEWLRESLPDFTISSFKKLGFNPDAKEAVIFAILANEMLAGKGFSMDPETDNEKKINFGKISFPH
jgi:anhydro-N-acetylmuramic acid kinase